MKQYFLLLNCFLVVSLSAQVKGIIRAASTNKAIPFALIFTPNFKVGTYSDTSGAFKLDVKPVDTIIIKHIGYQEVKILASTISTQNTVYLEEVKYTLEEYSVVANKTKKRVKLKQESQLCSCMGYSTKVGMWLMEEEKNIQQLTGVRLFITNTGLPKTPFRIMIKDGLEKDSKMIIPYYIAGKTNSGNSWVEVIFKEPINAKPPLFVEIEWIKAPSYVYKRGNSNQECFGMCIGLSKNSTKNNIWLNSNEMGWTQVPSLSEYKLMLEPLISKY